MGVEQFHGDIVLVVFGCFSLSVSNIYNSYLVGLGEDHCWLDNGVNILYQDLMHRFHFSDVSREVWHDGWDCGQVYG